MSSPYEQIDAFSAMYSLFFESQLALKSDSKHFRSVHISTDLGEKKS